KRINAVVLSRDKYRVERAAPGNAHVGDIKRLRVHLAVHWKGENFAELGGIHVPRRQRRFVQILPGPRIIVVPGENARGGLSRKLGLRADAQEPESCNQQREVETCAKFHGPAPSGTFRPVTGSQGRPLFETTKAT